MPSRWWVGTALFLINQVFSINQFDVVLSGQATATTDVQIAVTDLVHRLDLRRAGRHPPPDRGATMTDPSAAASGPDTPRSAYTVLERRATAATVALLLALAGIAWAATLDNARDMSSMGQGLTHVGTAMPLGMSAALFMSMWSTMMVAMMFPTIAPIVLLHRLVLRRRGEGMWLTTAFGAGYLAVWSLVGVVPLAVLIGFRHVASGSSWVERTGGTVLILAGVYQFTRWKETCQRACRTPLTFLVTHDFGRGAVGSFRAGVSHGLFCLGCCWALMAVLFVVGLMNLSWMAAIAVVFLAEKNWRHGVGLSKVAGAAVLLLGLAVLAWPSILGSVSPMGSGPPMMGS